MAAQGVTARGMSMTKKQLITALLMNADKTLPRTNVELVLDSLAKTAMTELRSTGEFALPGVGRFVVKVKKPRTARNPRTGASVSVAERRIVTLRPSKSLREGV